MFARRSAGVLVLVEKTLVASGMALLVVQAARILYRCAVLKTLFPFDSRYIVVTDHFLPWYCDDT
jgi:hypothetical protein